MNSPTIIDQVTERLHGEGGRMTAQRRSVLEALEELPGHPSAEELFESARQKDSSLNLSTVYRTLRWLEESGFVAPRWFTEEQRTGRYDRLPSGESSSGHHHFVCRVCGSVFEFVQPQVQSMALEFQRQYGALVEESTLTFSGLCRDCQVACSLT